MTEDQLQTAVIDLCDHLGLLWWHDNDSRRNGAGFLDLVIVGSRTLFVELKTDKGRITPEQQVWLDALRRAEDSDAAVWRPAHLRDGTITRILLDMSTEKPGRRMAQVRAEKLLRRRR